MTKYSRKFRRSGFMAKTINVARRNKKKRTTRKKRGGGCVNSTCRSQPSEVDANYIVDERNVEEKLSRFFKSEIFKKKNFNTPFEMENMIYDYINYYYCRDNNVSLSLCSGNLLLKYNIFRHNYPEVSRLFDLPDDIINLEFDNRFHDSDELIKYLLEKEPKIFKYLKADALNEILARVKFISQDIPNQELGGGRRKKTTKRRKTAKKEKNRWG
jgi:hypothetical protein